jgi:L-aspartate oxidase
MGGILTDASGRSTVEGLWACGEVASTGAHGANRLASNSLLEAVVFGARVAVDIASTSRPSSLKAVERELRVSGAHERDDDAVRTLRHAMTQGAGVIRDEASLKTALAAIATLESSGGVGDRRLANILTAAKLIATAALVRQESRGAHFRSDFPLPDARLAKRSFLTLEQAEAIARDAAEAVPSTPRRKAASSTLRA